MSDWANSRALDLMLMIARHFLVADEGKTEENHRITFVSDSHTFIVEASEGATIEVEDGGPLMRMTANGPTFAPYREVPKPHDSLIIEVDVVNDEDDTKGDFDEASAIITLAYCGDSYRKISEVRTTWSDPEFDTKLATAKGWFWPDHQLARLLSERNEKTGA